MPPEDLIKTHLLEAYKEIYGADRKKYNGACKISGLLKLPESVTGHNFYGVHKILLELKRDGHLEQKEGSGFRYKPE